MKVTPEMVRALHFTVGEEFSFCECKEALREHSGDIVLAAEWLRGMPCENCVEQMEEDLP